MGGSGSSGYDPPTPRPGDGALPGDDPCARLSFSAYISSPDPDVVPDLEVGDILDVVLTDNDGVPLVELRTDDASVAGTLTTNLGRLLPCIERRAYVAEVTSIDGGAVQVDVRAA